MLTAKNQYGEIVYIGELIKREGVHRLRENHYFCPVCKGKVIVKLGVQRISHFAHVQLSSICVEYERESAYHMQAKMQLFEWLETECSKPELEVFLPEIMQRPDLMFTFLGKTYCVEYQCSPISEEIFEKRTNGYLSSGLTPLWILGANRVHRKQTNLITLPKLQSLFIKRNNIGAWYLPSYCPSLKSFISITNLHPLSPHTMQCDYDVTPQSQLHLPQWLNPIFQNTFYVSNWRKGIQHVKDNIIHFHTHKLFLQELYRNQIHLYLLPPYVGVPLRDNLLFETSPIIWQMYVLLDNLFSKEVGIILTKEDVYKQLIKRIDRNHIKVRNHLKPSVDQLLVLIREYFYLLIKCQVLNEIKPNVYRYENLMSFPSTISEASKFEEQFYKNLTNEKIVWY
ncbi:competence protein CoiA [Bacillus sp. Y1]|nr:competence protein CoiA family protein [Bacillus sp. Y1]